MQTWQALLNDLATAVVMLDADDKPAIASAMSLQESLVPLVPSGAADAKSLLADLTAPFRGLLLDEFADREGTLKHVADSVRQAQDRLLKTPLPESAEEAPAQESAEAVSAPSTAPASDNSALPVSDAFTLPEWVDETIFREFLAGVPLNLEEVEALILRLEEGQSDALPELRRRIHTIKGESGVVGLDDIERVAHHIEDVIDRGQAGSDFADRLLQFTDWTNSAIKAYANGHRPEVSAEAILAALDGKDPAQAAQERAAAEAVPKVKGGLARDSETLSMIGDFLNESEEGLSTADEMLLTIETEGANAERINALFRTFHTIKGVAGFLELSDIANLAHDTETLLNQARQEQISLGGRILDVVFDSTAMMRTLLGMVQKAVETGEALVQPDGYGGLRETLRHAIEGTLPNEPLPPTMHEKRLGEALVERGAASPMAVLSALGKQEETGRRLGEELVASGEAKAKDVAQVLRAQKAGEHAAGTKIKETVKVDLERVDSLVEMIGELAIVEAMVVNGVNSLVNTLPTTQASNAHFIKDQIGQLAKISRDLQRVGMAMRMVPVRGVFQKMSRMVRDLSKKANKNVELYTNGEATEMDRSMVEQIGDPLVHMIRNSVDHGIETPEERLKAGKPERGSVHLSAYHEGGSIIIEIADDGRGLDRDGILAKARNKGMVRDGETPSDNDIYNLIFAPGFSTAKQVTEISGRGVGMDVVRRNIEGMRGRIVIQTAKGQGTTFKLVLPLTLAIIDGMLVACGREQYILPTLSIVESIQPDRSMLAAFAGKGELINLRGEMMPLIRLHRLFNVEKAEQDPTKALVVIMESVDKRVGLLVDEVVTQQQVVIKSLDQTMKSTKLVSGAAILSNGKVGLILNVEEVSKMTGEICREGVAGHA